MRRPNPVPYIIFGIILFFAACYFITRFDKPPVKAVTVQNYVVGG